MEHRLLEGQTVLLTGAAGGIGHVVARELSRAGAKLALTDIDAESVHPVVNELRDAGSTVIGQALDGSDREAVVQYHNRIVDELGPVDGLVNCAGLWRTGRFGELDPRAWKTILDANLLTAVSGCYAVLPGMLERRRGSIVNFASTSGEYGSITPAAHYAAAKGAVIAFTKSLAREAGPFQVRINAVSPGPIDTVALGAVTPEAKASVAARTLFGRLGQPVEIANACVFLLSPLSTFITGHVLRVNGGSLI
jgi:NAD(P)-dependent dehydrogenase (short-subunit alcohol dehydrogenase family)